MTTNKNIYAVILAGGSGTRFWPMSRRIKPKQFLEITGRQTLLEETIDRISERVPSKNIFIVTNDLYRKAIAKETRRFRIPAKNIFFEPQGKNTAPAIGWAASHIHQMDKRALMAVLPSDHLILNRKRFLALMDNAFGLAERNYLVTLGICPTRPETGYGYLKTSANKGVLKVQFKEKPTPAQAKEFIRKKNYFWNSGMFFWKAAVVLEEYRHYLPEVYRFFANQTLRAIVQNWKRLPSISVDYGILEKSSRVVAVPAEDLGWSDLGSWESLSEVLPKDSEGNVVKANSLLLNSYNNLIWSKDRLIAGIGLKDLIIIDTPDALLICPKAMCQDVKLIVGMLQKKATKEL